MVGLSDIPCVGVALNKISEATVEAAIHGLRYMLCYKTLLNDLNSQIVKVSTEEGRVARLIGEAKDDGMIIEAHVEAWQKNVQNVKTQADELTRQTTSATCFNVVRFPNPVSRFRLGRKAAHLATTVTQHTGSGEKFLANDIAHYAPYENLPISDTSYQIFPSRQEAYDKLWNALVNNDGSPIIGIYGMPGAGKTRMMEQAWKKLLDNKIFDKVARANVGGEQLDVIKLQEQLSGYLNCHLESKDNELKRASQLKRSLMAEGQKILVILDDVWADIPLNKIGIPFGTDGSSKGCKILLTSRMKNVCLRNNCTDPIEIKTLRNDEAWKMFSNTVGSSKIDSLKDPSLAEKVCKECGALPLLINAVGRSLKFSTESSWKNALYQLEDCQFQEIIDRIDPKLYTGIKFSFKRLGEGEKACLLLCSVFREDADIDIKMLFDMAMGSQLLGSRMNIDGLIDNLKSYSLLLEGKDDDKVKMHDIIRDVARSIATRDPDYAFLSLRCQESCLPDNAAYPTTRLLHLDLEGENVGFPDDLACPDLHTLWLQSNKHSQQLSSEFFNAFVNLKVLLLEGKFLFDQQLTIHNLGKLRVLILYGWGKNCKISQTFLSSVSRNLETLCIRDCVLPVPLDLPELKNLRKLELVDRHRLELVGMGPIEIVEEAISRISRVEELIVPKGFKSSRDDDDDAYIYRELSQLGCLKNLVITLEKLQDRDIFSSLVEFNILAADLRNFVYRDVKKKKYVFCRGIYVERWVMPLLERAEELKLDNVTGLPINGFSEIALAFANLKKMTLERCHEMEHVASWEGRNQRSTCFTNLTSLKINDCNRLKYVFSDSVVKCLLRLQTLEVKRCSKIEEIIRVEDSTDHDGQKIICFPNLQTLILTFLPSLTSFCKKKDSLFDGSLTFNTLKKLYVVNCGVSTLFTSSVFRSLHQLQELKVSDCRLLKEIVEEEDARDDGTNENKTPISLPHLQSLTLNKLPNLQNIGISACYMPALVKVEVTECGMITSLFTRSAFTNLQNLWELKVSDCSLLEEIVEEEDARDDGTNEKKTPISLLHLQYVILSKLPNLQNIGISACYMPTLVAVEVTACGMITSLFTRSAFTNLQHLERLELSDCSLLKEIVEEEDARDDGTNENKTPISLLHLKYVILSILPNLQNIEISACYMPALVKVEVTACGMFTSLFTRSAFRNLQNLRRLDVSYCHLLEEIVEDEMDDGTNEKKTPISLLQLKYVILSKLPNLQNIGISACYMPTLVAVEVTACGMITSLFTRSAFTNLQNPWELKVSDCSLLEVIVEDEMDDGTNEKKTPISLPHLQSLTLNKLPNLQNIGISACYMPALVKVEVTECGMITSLFTRSAFTNLQNLWELKVSDCSLLEEIVEEEDATDDGTNEKKTPISLLHLQYVILSKLPNLQNIGISACYMPALVKVEVTACGMITSLFTRSAFTNLQNLWVLKVSDCSLLKEIVEEEDSRDDGTNENKTPISLPHLESITLLKLPNLQNIGISVCYMPALLWVGVTACGMITSLFTRSAFTNLQHLRELKVSDCSLLKEIVEEEDARDDGTNEKKTPISLLHLRLVILSKLPNLQNIEISACYMPALVMVNVTACGIITSLFTRSAFTNLKNLWELKVSDCSLLEVIVEDEMDDVTSGMSEKMISLPLLTIITLENLPKVRSFSSSTTFTFDIPALGDLSLSNCPEWRYPHPITAPALTMLSDNNQEMIDES